MNQDRHWLRVPFDVRTQPRRPLENRPHTREVIASIPGIPILKDPAARGLTSFRYNKLHGWVPPRSVDDFAVAFVGAAAALLGLAFVAISFNLEPILQDERLPAPCHRHARVLRVHAGFRILILLPGLSLRAVGLGQAVLALGLAFTIGMHASAPLEHRAP